MKMEQKLKLYLDTTIPNYVYADHLPEKKLATVKLFEEIKHSLHRAYISDVVLGEIKRAGIPLRDKLLKTIKDIEIITPSDESESLASRYIKDGIIPARFRDDARHVAIASINNMDAVISWNYEHLVNLQKTKRINVVNEIMGYKHIEIVTPMEVIQK